MPFGLSMQLNRLLANHFFTSKILKLALISGFQYFSSLDASI